MWAALMLRTESMFTLSIRSVQLSFLRCLDNGGHWYGLLEEMRKKMRENTL